jgi:hypothetical protein
LVTAAELGGDVVGDFARNPAQVEREQHGALAARVGEGERFDPQLHDGAVGGPVAIAVAGHPVTGGRSDLFPGGAGLPGAGGRGGKQGGESEQRDGEQGEAGGGFHEETGGRG